MNAPLFSIIIPTFNAASKLALTLESAVLQEPVAAREVLVIDGSSTDHTLNVLKSYEGRIRWISERDLGIYAAMNKGIRLARGRYLYFLGAGDLIRHGVLNAVASEARLRENEQAAFVYGNVFWKDFKEIYDGEFTPSKLADRNICHQAIFYHRAIFERLGPYETEYRYCADWVLNMKCFSDNRITKVFIPITIAEFEGGGRSTYERDSAFVAARPALVKEYLETTD